jgi:multidrug efflux system membrane fusion protein
MRWRSKFLLLVLIGIGVGWYGLASGRLASFLAGAALPVNPAGPVAVPVTAGQVEVRDVPIWLSGIGSIQPLQAVTVKVRVDGQLERVLFIEGQDVRAGDPLAQIDPRLFQAQLRQVQANKAKDEVQLANARLDLQRSTTLAAKGIATKQSLDTQKAQVSALDATVAADQAAIDTASLQLEFTTVRAPLSGRAGLRLLDPGSIVHASDANGLVTITQMQPITALFTVPQDDLPDVLAAMREGDVTVIAYSREGDRSLATGKLVFVDSQVDPATGQVKLKASFDNSDRALWPGQFVNARLHVRTIKGAATAPNKAIEHGQQGPYVFRIKPDNTVELQPVTVSAVSEALAVISSGLSRGDRIVVDGQYRLQPGTLIEAQPATVTPR